MVKEKKVSLSAYDAISIMEFLRGVPADVEQEILDGMDVTDEEWQEILARLIKAASKK
jgi:hypothetical protein